MDIAVLSDIHGNYASLERCLEYALSHNIRTFFFLGDTDSHCPHYKIGDSIYFDGAIIDKDKSDNLCMMALNAIFHLFMPQGKALSGKSLFSVRIVVIA